MTEQNDDNISCAHKSHPRTFLGSSFVYPVLSRRSGGISIGINLSPNRVCNFNCVYCQVKNQPATIPADSKIDQQVIEQIENELITLIQMVYKGDLFEHAPFDTVPQELRRLCDISFSGDGEPTSSEIFDTLCTKVANIKKQYARDDVKIVLITNSTLLHKPKVQEALAVLDLNNGEIWAKLDAGTEKYYATVNRSGVAFEKILDNILRAAQKRPIKIQTLFMNIMGSAPDQQEITAYIDRLNFLTDNGAHIKAVQLHTVARQPAESFIEPLTNAQLDAIAHQVQSHTSINIETYYGSSN